MMLTLLLSLILLEAASAGGDCPAPCECRTYPRDLEKPDLLYTVLICRSDLKSLELPDDTEGLHFVNGSVDFGGLIDNLCELQSLPYFARLSFTGVSMRDVSNISVSLDRLRSLEMVDCGLTKLPRFNMSSLMNLDLSRNALEAVLDEQFRTLQVLEVLNLSVNALANVEPEGFAGLSTLKCLDLSRNNFSALADHVFLPLESLQHLNLSNNRLEVLNEACFSSLLYLQQLDVSWNRLAKVAPGSLQLPSLARLLLEGNSQLGNSSEPSLLVATGRRLQTVDASRTGLKQVPSALTHSIRTLRLAGNSIRAVSCGDLDSYPLLQLLDFTANELSEIEEDALGRLDSLTVLYLTDNKLRFIPHSLPEKLRVLHLEQNEIQNIQPADLQGLTQLEVLLLTHNKIKSVRELPFTQLVSLNSLDLSHNPFVELPAGSLTGPQRLRVLRLAGLSVISPIKATSFPLSTPENLITLDLSNSPGLARQMLADTAALAASRELQELDLSNSGLIYIRSDLLHFLPQLRALHLQDNPLNCSGLQWLAVWMRRQDNAKYHNIDCASPPELWGTLLIDLQSIEPETTTINYTFTTANQIQTYALVNHVTTKSPISDDKTITTTSTETAPNKITSTERNLKPEITTKYIVGYRGFPAKPMNILAESKSSPEKVNDVLKEQSNLFMKKSQHTENSTAEMSMYSGDSRVKNFAHPGMLILSIGILFGAAMIVLLTNRMNRKRQPVLEDIEVSSLPSVTELW